jgi:hypothetical protein
MQRCISISKGAHYVRQMRFQSVVTQSPREAIFESLLHLKTVAESKSDSDLSKPKSKFDGKTLPEDFKEFDSYLATVQVAKVDKFVKDPAANHNKSFLSFVSEEIIHEDTWPYLVGGM